MLKLITAITLLMSAPAMDAAPLVSGVPDFLQVSLNRGDQKPQDPRTKGPDFQGRTATGSLAKFLRAEPVMMFANGQGKTVAASLRLDKTTSTPSYLDENFMVTFSSGRQQKIASVAIDSEELEKMVPSTNNFNSYLTIDPVINEHKAKAHTTTEGNGFYKQLKLAPLTTSNKQRKILIVTNRAKISLSTSSPDRREKLIKMLSALEELQRAMNSTLSSHITIITRGASNGRNSGKKTKMVVSEGSQKSTTMSSVASSSTSPRTSTDQADPKLLNGKSFKKSLPSTPKKNNKRVCFWKYCSQN